MDCCQAFEIRYTFFEGHLSEGQTRDNFIIQELAKKKDTKCFSINYLSERPETVKHV